MTTRLCWIRNILIRLYWENLPLEIRRTAGMYSIIKILHPNLYRSASKSSLERQANGFLVKSQLFIQIEISEHQLSLRNPHTKLEVLDIFFPACSSYRVSKLMHCEYELMFAKIKNNSHDEHLLEVIILS